MGWTVETLDEKVDAEIEALPEDMRARLVRIAQLIEEIGLERVGKATRQAYRRPSLGDAAERPQRNLEGIIRDGREQTSSDRAGL
jgi:hypothetical protein